jgi:molybdate transport system substrate-binding protein
MNMLGRGSSHAAAIVPLSLAMAQEMAKIGDFAVIPAGSHRSEQLEQRVVLLKNAGDIATELCRYLRDPAARAILSRYGFEVPSE